MEFELVVSGIVVFLLVLYYFERRKTSVLEKLLTDEKFRGRSLSVKYGKMSEQFFPFLDTYPYDKQNFRFLGSPIDGIQFEKDKIIFIEFKANTSKLTDKEKEIRWLIKNKKVQFEERRIK